MKTSSKTINTINSIVKIILIVKVFIETIKVGIRVATLKAVANVPEGKELEKLVRLVWDKNYSTINKYTQMAEKPTLVFHDDDTEGSAVAYVEVMQKCKDFSGEVLETSTNHVIHINLNAMRKGMIAMNQDTKRDLSTEYIFFVLTHECQHIRQSDTGWWIGRKRETICFGAEGKQVQEKDANEVAIRIAKHKGKETEIVAEMAKKQHEAFVVADTTKEITELRKSKWGKFDFIWEK